MIIALGFSKDMTLKLVRHVSNILIISSAEQGYTC